MKRETICIISASILVIILSVVSICVGAFPLSLSTIVEILTGHLQDSVEWRVFFTLRLPRVGMGLLAGAGLGMAGGIYQIIFRNALASPDLTGVASGASFGAAFAIIYANSQILFVILGAFLGGMITVVFLLFLTMLTKTSSSYSYLLAGVIVSSIASAGLMLLKSLADPTEQLMSIEFWIMGSLASITLEKFSMVAGIILICMGILLLFKRQMLMLSMGKDLASSMGISSRTWMYLLLFLTTLLVASIVCITGVISFVGLLAPHIAYLLLGKKSGAYLLLSALCGSGITLAADLFARTIKEGAELPLSIPIILLAVPMLSFLLYKEKERVL